MTDETSTWRRLPARSRPRAAVTHVLPERPILFSSPMIRASLAGRKTVTRRIVRIDDKPVRVSAKRGDAGAEKQRGIPSNATNVRYLGVYLKCDAPPGSNTVSSRVLCPYGMPGDRLWVRETFALVDGPHVYTGAPSEAGEEWSVIYRADEDVPNVRWHPSIFMPKWASRITLEILSVRVERLHDITEEDAKGEGVSASMPCQINGEIGEVHNFGPEAHRQAFAQLWDGINGERAPWAANPYVWRVEFRKVDGVGNTCAERGSK